MGYTFTKGNYQSFFPEYITFSVNFNVGFLGGMTDICSTRSPVLYFRNHVPELVRNKNTPDEIICKS
jgi:hypothetical protein